MNFCFKFYSRYSILIAVLVCVFITPIAHSQPKPLVNEANELIYSNPDEAIKIGQHLLQTSKEEDKNSLYNLIIAKSYSVKGDYNDAIISLFQANQYLPEATVKTQIEVNLLKAELLRVLYLDELSKKYLEQSRDLSHQLEPKSTQDSIRVKIDFEQASMLLERHKPNEALKLITETYNQHKRILKNNEQFYLLKGIIFSNASAYDSAYYCFDKSLHLIEKSASKNYFSEVVVRNQLWHLYLQQKEYKKGEVVLFKAFDAAKTINNISQLRQINQNLAINYLATNDKAKHKAYNNEFLILSNKVDQLEQESINTLYNLLGKEQEKNLEQQQQSYTINSYIAFGGFVLLILIIIGFLLKSFWKRKRLKEIISYLEISRSNFLKLRSNKGIRHKKTTIPIDTEKAILTKLRRFESSTKFLNKEMSLAILSGQFDTNTKYLSEIINKHYHDNFNTFINKLRINYIIEKLKTDANYVNYKISFLADECGFSSHSSFATVFKSIIGMSPATFIGLLNEDQTEEKNKILK